MSISSTDVNVNAVQTDNDDFKAGSAIRVQVRAEVGQAKFDEGGKYRVRLTMTDITNPSLIDSQETVGLYGDTKWPAAGDNVFAFSVPAAATAGRAGSLLQPQARLAGGASGRLDNSFVIGDTVLLTP